MSFHARFVNKISFVFFKMAFSKSKSISFKAFWILTEILAVFALVFLAFLTGFFFYLL